ncbi:NAD(P)H-dependent oxidoreductase subunit E [Thiogranum longum]
MGSAENPESFVTALLGGDGGHRERLVQYLYEIQYHYSFVPYPAVQRLAAALDLPEAQIQGVVEFYAFLHATPRGDFDILFSDSITDHMLGSRALLHRLCGELGVQPGIPRADGRVTVDLTSCTGMCDQGPALLVNGWTVTKLNVNRLIDIARLVESGTPVTRWPQPFFAVQDNIHRRDMLLQEDIAPGNALQSLLDSGPDKMLGELESSGLRGLGGAGFRTGMKWRLCREAKAQQRYVVCNADEGEPGTFKDRVLLNSYADGVFEGMTLCAAIVGASKGYLYLRGEYRFLRERLQSILAQRRAAGLLGNDILGKQGFDFDIEIRMGAGAYICGEESALLESLEGKRGVPRTRPPFPVTHGYLNRPTVVNNVETFLAAAKIAVHGADWFRAKGTEQSTGSKLMSISGDCSRPGIYEYPFGVSIDQILSDCDAQDTQAVQISGAAGTTVPRSEFGRTLAFEDVSTGGAFMIFNRDRDMLDMVQNFAAFFRHESCGFCTPCRVGGALLKDLVDKVHAGRATAYDLQEMRNIGSLMREASQCGLGHTAPNPVLDTLQQFPDIYQRRIMCTETEPSFDLDTALDEARAIAGRDHRDVQPKATP